MNPKALLYSEGEGHFTKVIPFDLYRSDLVNGKYPVEWFTAYCEAFCHYTTSVTLKINGINMHSIYFEDGSVYSIRVEGGSPNEKHVAGVLEYYNSLISI